MKHNHDDIPVQSTSIAIQKQGNREKRKFKPVAPISLNKRVVVPRRGLNSVNESLNETKNGTSTADTISTKENDRKNMMEDEKDEENEEQDEDYREEEEDDDDERSDIRMSLVTIKPKYKSTTRAEKTGTTKQQKKKMSHSRRKVKVLKRDETQERKKQQIESRFSIISTYNHDGITYQQYTVVMKKFNNGIGIHFEKNSDQKPVVVSFDEEFSEKYHTSEVYHNQPMRGPQALQLVPLSGIVSPSFIELGDILVGVNQVDIKMGKSYEQLMNVINWNDHERIYPGARKQIKYMSIHDMLTLRFARPMTIREKEKLDQFQLEKSHKSSSSNNINHNKSVLDSGHGTNQMAKNKEKPVTSQSYRISLSSRNIIPTVELPTNLSTNLLETNPNPNSVSEPSSSFSSSLLVPSIPSTIPIRSTSNLSSNSSIVRSVSFDYDVSNEKKESGILSSMISSSIQPEATHIGMIRSKTNFTTTTVSTAPTTVSTTASTNHSKVRFKPNRLSGSSDINATTTDKDSVTKL